MTQEFNAPEHLIDDRIDVLLLGGGGTGSEVFDALSRIHIGLRKREHPGLHVTLMDADRVSETNVGRQRFGTSDVNHYKSWVLVNRYNLFFHLGWKAIVEYWDPGRPHCIDMLRKFDLLVSCVDRASVRVALAQAGAELQPPVLWLDFGNGSNTAQCVLGHLGSEETPLPLRLPNLFDLFPEVTDVQDELEPSCSFVEAERRQNLFVNRTIADAGMSLLWSLLTSGSIQHHGAFVDVKSGTTTPLPIDPQAWSFLRDAPASNETSGRSVSALSEH